MRLCELVAGGEVRRIRGNGRVEISGLSYDSRRTSEGDLFFSLARDPDFARANAKEALSRGARAVVMRGRVDEALGPAVVVVESERPRLLMGAAAARFFHAERRRLEVIGVTGTSGKTTTTYLLRSIFEAAGLATGIIGTVGAFIGQERIYQGLTTPEAIDFESALARMETAGMRYAAAEISSIGLAEGRVDSLRFHGAIFTNLGRDHLDYHHTLENYFAAKLRLFTDLIARPGTSRAVTVIRADDPYGARILGAIGSPAVTFGLDASLDTHPVEVRCGLGGIHGSIRACGEIIRVDSPLVGEINLPNILGACALSVALGINKSAVEEGVRRCHGAPGRMEAVSVPRGITVLVDYAHKPDALEAVLTTLRRLTKGRLICVFGCGGDRDRGKRAMMGEIAGRLTDLSIVTSDNPRSEDPLSIIAQIEQGLRSAGVARLDRLSGRTPAGYLMEPDRRAAIRMALESAVSGDIVLVAGKGHEDYQLVGDRVVRFDDRSVVREIGSRLEDLKA